MHTEPKDPHGQDLEHIINHLGLNDRQIMLSTKKLPAEHLADLYNMVVDMTNENNFLHNTFIFDYKNFTLIFKFF